MIVWRFRLLSSCISPFNSLTHIDWPYFGGPRDNNFSHWQHYPEHVHAIEKVRNSFNNSPELAYHCLWIIPDWDCHFDMRCISVCARLRETNMRKVPTGFTCGQPKQAKVKVTGAKKRLHNNVLYEPKKLESRQTLLWISPPTILFLNCSFHGQAKQRLVHLCSRQFEALKQKISAPSESVIRNKALRSGFLKWRPRSTAAAAATTAATTTRTRRSLTASTKSTGRTRSSTQRCFSFISRTCHTSRIGETFKHLDH